MIRIAARIRALRPALLLPVILALGAGPAARSQADAAAAADVSLVLCGYATLDSVRADLPDDIATELAVTATYRDAHPRPMDLGNGATLRFVRGEITLAQLEGRTCDELDGLLGQLEPALRGGNVESARQLGETLVCYNTGYAPYRDALAFVYVQAGRRADAARQHEVALALDPQGENAWAARATAALAGAAVSLGRGPIAGPAPTTATPSSAATGAAADVAFHAAADGAAQQAREALKDFVDPEGLPMVVRTALQTAAATPADYADEFLTANDYYADLQEAQRHMQIALQAGAAGLWPEAGDAFWRATTSAESASAAWPQISANLACLLQTASAAAQGLAGEIRSGRDRAGAAAGRDAAPIFRQRALQAAQLLAQLQGTALDKSTPPANYDPQNNVPQYGPLQSYCDSVMSQMMWNH